ncbi:MAG: arginine--tRNA ligase [Bacillota bacterium]
MEETLRKAIAEALAAAGAPDTAFVVEWPATLAHGDYATNAAMAAAKALGKNPRELADELVLALRTTLTHQVSSIEVAGPGFINFTLARPVISGIVKEVAELGSGWGRGSAAEGKRVSIEYSNPNAFKEMHIGHLMGSIVGESVSRLIENSGATVIRDTFGGDIGPNVAKCLWALQNKGVTDVASAAEIGAAYIQGANAYEESEAAKAEIDALNTRIYDVVARQDEELTDEERMLLALWRKGREVSMEEFRRIWKTVDTHFDYEFFDSDTGDSGIRIVRDGLGKGVFKESDGAVIYDGEEKGVHTMVFITSRGTPTYEAKDIGLAFLREEKIPNDTVIIVTGNEQTGRFRTVLAALEEIAPRIAEKTRHIATGFLTLTTGKMASRKGNIITASELITDVIGRASEKNPDPLIAEAVAIGAIKYMILRSAPGANIIFDPVKSLSLEGDSGPYLQYALVRARSVLAQAGEGERDTGAPEEVYDLERVIIRFPEVAALACAEEAPHKVAQYLTQLAGEWNSFYAKERIIGGEYEGYKLALARAFAMTMENGLRLLAIPTPERM